MSAPPVPPPAATPPAAVDPFEDHDHDACAIRVLERAILQSEAEGVRLTPVRKRALEILLDRIAPWALTRCSSGSQPTVSATSLPWPIARWIFWSKTVWPTASSA
ncbi:hypothetical protein QWZ10_11895 [Paracoccus cavernae]|uniref:Uncharacterized protein n=1 Tax=Paracoccus cavernae TaxID=1571207 RepID=A0ABT8D8P7_9RHOB|nr:hypothetical protein [Paracoccus cavernae]